MAANLDELFLSGAIFNERSSSPARSASPDHDFLNSESEDLYDSDAERNKEIEKMLEKSGSPNQSIGMGPGRTGVKGVIRDRAEARRIERERKEREVTEINARMERANLGGKTYLEEERERELEKMMLEGADVIQGRKNLTFPTGHGKERFGHLREVNSQGYIAAVEEEAPSVWVVVHIYDPSLDRCHNLNSSLTQLARLHPETKFLRIRAGPLGFAAKPSSAKRRTWATLTRRYTDEEDESYSDEKEIDEDSEEEADVDLDVLPTVLVYKNGELVHNWVRVDWEAGKDGVDELLYKHQIIQSSGYNFEDLDADLLENLL